MPKRSPAVFFIFITLLIEVFGFGIAIPVMPRLVLSLLGDGASLSLAATYGGWLISSYAITQFFCSPIVGGLSDRYGRRPVLLGSLLGLLLTTCFSLSRRISDCSFLGESSPG